MLNNYEEKIVLFLSEATEPVYVEKIRVSCGIGNWQTALKHCLVLFIQGRIKGRRTSKSWEFWIDKAKGESD